MTGRTDRASRTIRASPSVLYRAFADPEAVESWLPPAGMTGHMERFDFRDGGSYRMRLTYEDENRGSGKSSADTDEVEVRFVRLVEDRRIEQAVTFDSERSRPPREPVAMDGERTFHFVTDGVGAALERALEAADGQDVRVGGGASTVRQYLEAGLIDEMHLAIVPVLLGDGERLFERVGPDLPSGYECVAFVGTEAVAHGRIARRVDAGP